jgi:hypothetical protein
MECREVFERERSQATFSLLDRVVARMPLTQTKEATRMLAEQLLSEPARAHYDLE